MEKESQKVANLFPFSMAHRILVEVVTLEMTTTRTKTTTMTTTRMTMATRRKMLSKRVTSTRRNIFGSNNIRKEIKAKKKIDKKTQKKQEKKEKKNSTFLRMKRKGMVLESERV